MMAACATAPPPRDPTPEWQTGRLSLRVDAGPTRAAQGFSAAFELRGSGAQGELRLLSPLGSQLAGARWDGRGAILATPEGERRFDTLESLAQAAFGEPLPLAALPSWLAGRPWPAAPFRATAEGFEQLGWRIATGAQAEGRLEARRESPPAVLLRVRLDLPGS